MKKIGQILKSEGKYSWVKMGKGASCGEGRCPLSTPLIDDSQSQFYVVKAYNELGASPGDKVLVEIKDNVALGIAFLIYIFPILLTLFVYLFLSYLTSLALYHYLGVAASIIISLFILKKEDQKIQLNYRITDFADSTCQRCSLSPDSTLSFPE
ncbi:MAG TPA: SoxR reducing system RseC family protein [Candidatus Atribacteria bacterium]|nr:SoxR reducing system RseC family protein [Candidatus Atribacteria bacterium]